MSVTNGNKNERKNNGPIPLNHKGDVNYQTTILTGEVDTRRLYILIV